jgi:hypothetical protein
MLRIFSPEKSDGFGFANHETTEAAASRYTD